MAASETAWAEAWPTRAIRIVVSTPAGGITDAFARAYGDYISQKLGQPVIVENKTGASGALAAQSVKDSPADGYTLMYTISSTLLGNRLLLKSLAYDPDKDFTIVAVTPSGHLPLVVHSATNAKTIEEFVAYARGNKVTAGSYGIGSFAHIAIAELNRQFGLDISIVHYRGEAPMWQDLAAGVIQAAVGSYQAALPVLDTGVGRPIAVPTPVRMKKLPETRTFTEQGVTGSVFQLTSFYRAGGARCDAGRPDRHARQADGRRRQDGARAEAARCFRRRPAGHGSRILDCALRKGRAGLARVDQDSRVGAAIAAAAPNGARTPRCAHAPSTSASRNSSAAGSFRNSSASISFRCDNICARAASLSHLRIAATIPA
ncbi:tripartite-type tricarboxylate transporter receptor subunit TctC [Bradyrhizobium sp. F1.13.4]